MTAYVLDASVAAKWFLPPAQESLADEALEILDGYSKGRLRLTVPDLFWPEIGNILWKAVRQKRIGRNSADESIAAIRDAKIGTEPSAPLLTDAFAIASAFDQTVYDGIYVALAVVSGMALVTADERLANSLAARFPIRWLGAL